MKVKTINRKSYRNYLKRIPKSTYFNWAKKKKSMNVDPIENTVSRCSFSCNLPSNNSSVEDTISSYSSSSNESTEKEFIDTDASTELSEEKIIEAVITLFFKGHLTQVAINCVIDLINIVSTVKIPNNFNKCLKYLEDRGSFKKIPFKKRWFCGICMETVEGSRYGRMCGICSNR